MHMCTNTVESWPVFQMLKITKIIYMLACTMNAEKNGGLMTLFQSVFLRIFEFSKKYFPLAIAYQQITNVMNPVLQSELSHKSVIFTLF